MQKKSRQRDARSVVLREAYLEFRLRGFQAANINRIASKTKMTKGTMYYYFKSKKDIGYAVVDDLIEEMVTKVWLQPLRSCEDPIECLQNIIRKTTAQLTEEDIQLGEPLINLALEMAPLDKGFRQRFDRLRITWCKAVAAALRRGQKSGHVSTTINPAKIATQLLAFMIGNRALGRSSQRMKLFRDCQKNLVRFLQNLRPA